MFWEGLQAALAPDALLVIVIGATVALITGALPGMGAGLTMAIAIPLTFYMDAKQALMLMGAIYTTCVYGGGITAILLNVPGTSGSAASCLDGYAMSEKGKAGTALGISLAGSTIGSIVSTILLMVCSALLIKVVLLFGPAEYFWVAVLGLTIIATVSQGAFLKGIIAATIGFLLSIVGINSITGDTRYTFGTIFLQDGLHLIPVLLAFFSVSQILKMVDSKQKTISQSGKITGSVFEGIITPLKYWWTTIRSCLIGFVIGALPGVGYSVSNWIAYGVAKQSSPNSDSFGQGEPEGVLAPETANNATVGGALVPTLVLGIPGGETTAILLGAMLIHGVTPGLDLFRGNGAVLYSFYMSLFISAVVMFLIGLVGMRYVARVTVVPTSLLIPIIIIVTFTGAYATNMKIGDMVVIAILGLFAYGMRKFGYPVVAASLAFILGPILEKNYSLAMISSEGSLAGLAGSPLSIILIILVIGFAGYGIYTEYFKDTKKEVVQGMG